MDLVDTVHVRAHQEFQESQGFRDLRDQQVLRDHQEIRDLKDPRAQQDHLESRVMQAFKVHKALQVSQASRVLQGLWDVIGNSVFIRI